MTLHSSIARDLLEIDAIKIKTEKDEYFTWTSGIKSPIYCDNRLTMSYPLIRKRIMQAFVEMLRTSSYKPDVIAGCATAGIPHAAWLANELDLPMIYVRSSPKGHGKGNQIEGLTQRGQKVLVIEDLISTGGSSIDVAEILHEEGLEVEAVFAIFTYGLQQSVDSFHHKNIPIHTITSFDQLLQILVEDEEMTLTEEQELLAWRHQL